MDEKTKREWNELQNELAELQKTVDEYENWIKTEGAELEDMYAQLQFLNKSEDDEVPEHPFRLPEDYPLPREILQQHFPRTANQCNFSGGWGTMLITLSLSKSLIRKSTLMKNSTVFLWNTPLSTNASAKS